MPQIELGAPAQIADFGAVLMEYDDQQTGQEEQEQELFVAGEELN